MAAVHLSVLLAILAPACYLTVSFKWNKILYDIEYLNETIFYFLFKRWSVYITIVQDYCSWYWVPWLWLAVTTSWLWAVIILLASIDHSNSLLTTLALTNYLHFCIFLKVTDYFHGLLTILYLAIHLNDSSYLLLASIYSQSQCHWSY